MHQNTISSTIFWTLSLDISSPNIALNLPYVVNALFIVISIPVTCSSASITPLVCRYLHNCFFVTLFPFWNTSLYISCFNSTEILSPSILILFISLRTQKLWYSSDALGSTGSSLIYVQRRTIRDINASDVAFISIFSLIFHGKTCPSSFLTTQPFPPSLLLFSVVGPT